MTPLYERPQDIVGMAEIAEMAGVTTQAACNWKKRKGKTNFPKPYCKLAMGPIYDRQDIEKWLVENRAFWVRGKPII